MKRVVITYYDKDLENYSNPQVTNYSDADDLKLDLRNGVKKLMKESDLQNLVHKNLEVIGTFDNVTGEFENQKIIVDCDVLISSLRPDFVEKLKKSAEILEGK